MKDPIIMHEKPKLVAKSSNKILEKVRKHTSSKKMLKPKETLRRTRSSQPATHEKNNNQLQQNLANKVRIAVFGFGGVGKTSLIKRFLYDDFDEQYNETVEDDYRQVLEYNETVCDVTILDTAGSYQFPAMRKLAIESCHGFILVYALDSNRSFEEVKRIHKSIVDIKQTPNVPVILVGNKTDSVVQTVSNDEVRALLDNMGNKSELVETSAKRNDNTKLVFYDLMRLIEEEKNEIIEKELMNKHRSRSRMSSLRASFSHAYKSLSPEERRRKSLFSSDSISD